MKVIVSSVFGFLAFVPLFASPAKADRVTDLYFQEAQERYFEYPQNARTFGMAGSSVQTSTDSSNVFSNPAGLGFMTGGEASASYGRNRISGDEFPTRQGIHQDSNLGSGMITMPISPVREDLPEYGNFGIGWNQTSSRWQEDTFDTISERTQVNAAYAYSLSSSLSLGYSLGWTDDKFQAREIFNYPMGNGLRHTVGASWKVDPDQMVAGSVFVGHGKHHALYGPGIKGDSSTNAVGVDAGWQMRMDDTTLAVGVDYRHLDTNGDVISSIPANIVGGNENGNIFDARLGVEQRIDNEWSARAGYRFAGLASYSYNRVELNDLNGSAYYSALTLGAGYRYSVKSDYITALHLDYGVEYRDVAAGDWQHVVTISIPFGVCRSAL